jgi:hypothetical protein
VSATRPRPAACRLSWPAALAAALVLAGCGAPPELGQSATPMLTTSATPTATPSATPTVPVPAATPVPQASPSDLVATACPAGPSGDRVVRLLRGSAGVLPRDARVGVRSGPLCAADWQYTVLTVSGHEELQVVTRGRPTALELVTAGTDVCSAEVRVAGPLGIRTLACAGTPGA